MNVWLKSWIGAFMALFFLMTAIGGGWFLYVTNQERNHESDYVINEVRLAVNPLLLFMEQHYENIRDQHVQATLRALSGEHDVALTYAGLSGEILFSTSPYKQGDRLNLRSSLHYDLHEATQNDGSYRITFPVLDADTDSHVANAIFHIAKERLGSDSSSAFPLTMLIVSFLLFLGSVALLLVMRTSFHSRILSPVRTLQGRAEAILRGNYEPPSHIGTQFARMDELGGLYAMMDQITLELKEQRKRRARQEKAQKELITNISHEIRTPITTVKAYMEAILEGVCSDRETMLEYVGIMRNHTDKMSRQVEDLFLHAMEELGQISVEPKERYSMEVFPPILSTLGHYARTQGIAYRESLNMPNVLLPVDAARIEQVLTNLVTNALKHTSPGDTIHISADLEENHLVFTVADTGRGIRPQDMPFLFERYYRGQSGVPGQAIATEGNGLGLSICKNIVEAHGGVISFKSREGQGTEFYFTLPLC
ncbi:cell wall metabolism sensor histidine kinase WalK [Paenibacillus sp. MY03]|uniref:sensor histidine kinase n=1 Tax=Paenibacillus sp. MY03 TaxID=302980 RepID=UPI00211AD5DA|nr:HAMP domain-containing sensor histidine kinase [Paenibacillus sp. MY03]